MDNLVVYSRHRHLGKSLGIPLGNAKILPKQKEIYQEVRDYAVSGTMISSEAK